jgi:hypothetical protein
MLTKMLENGNVTTRTLCPKEERRTETTETSDVNRA